MKYLPFFIALLMISFAGITQQKFQHVNAFLHDESYVVAFDALPGAATDEQLRIRTHLAYVEKLLRSAHVTNLTSKQRANRLIILDHLHEYWQAGIFPSNHDYPDERRPCFIDAAGNICAVGYLIEQTKGRTLAEHINASHQYDFIMDMSEPTIEAWANEFGLTMNECAMIQPAYGPPSPAQTSNADIKKGYGISSGLIGGTNIAISTANLSGRFKNNAALSYIGLVTGTGQIIMGIANIKSTSIYPQINGGETWTSYKAQNNLSYINIAAGATTLVTSTLNLVIQKKNKDKRNTFNLYSYPDYNNTLSMGLYFTRKI